jgi:peptidoglycan glycosyltransferase
VAESLLRGKCGAAVAIEPSTGRVIALASSPSYDPNLVEKNFAKAQKAPGYPCKPPAPLLDRATNGLYPPGSTFKVVTTTAALDTGAFRPDSRFSDPGYCTEYGKKVLNAGNPDQGGPEAFGSLTLAQGLQHSVNSVYCNIGKKMGAGPIIDYAKRFGFYSTPPVQLPSNELSASGLYNNGSLWEPKDPATQVDPGRLAFGQERMLVTPLQMAMVAATVANGGVRMEPQLVDRVVAPDGKVVTRVQPQQLDRVMKAQTAQQVAQMMVSVVQGGTGTAAQISGVQVGGKTGTAETGERNVYIPWFIAFAPADHPKVAVAVVVEDVYRGFGGSVSAPIAKQIMQAILAGR